MTDVLYGKVLSVETANLGEPAAAASIGATVVPVADAATFDELGGTVTINGQVLSFVATDVDLDTITLAAALTAAVADGDMVEVFPPSPVKTVLVDMGDNSDPLPAIVPLQLLDRLPDGTREPNRQETVALERRGTYEYVVADVTAEPVISQTLNYTEAESGIGLSESLAQFQDANVLGQLATPQLSADAISLGGVDLETRLDGSSIGKLLSARLGQVTAPAITTTLTKMLELNCGTVQAGRTYRVRTSMLLSCSGTLAASDRVKLEYHYTIDGTTPTTASPGMDDDFNDTYVTPNVLVLAKPEAEIDATSTGQLRVGLCAQLVSGAGTYTIYTGSSSRSRPVMALYDDGPSGSRNDSAISLTGGGVTTFTKTFNAAWALGSNGSGAELDNSWVFIGADLLANYNFGLVGFDSAAIVAALTNATTPTSCVLRWVPRARANASGLDVEILSHNYASLAAAKAVVGGVPVNYFDYGSAFTLQTTKLNAVPNTSGDTSLGTTVFNQFKAGTRKGVGFANPSLDAGGTGSVFGDGASQAQLIFTYQGTS